jgi:hypothetical protein
MPLSSIARVSGPVLLVALFIAGCGDRGSSAPSATNGGATTPSTGPAAASTTTALTPADLVLRVDGIGPLAFGTPAADVVGRFGDVLGPATSDESVAYPNEPMPGQFESADGSTGFSHPHERTVCFANGLCTTFGGSTPEQLAFVGWEHGSAIVDTAPTLLTADGVTIGSRWADFAGVMTVSDLGCAAIGYGETAGVGLELAATTGAAFAPQFGPTDGFEQPDPDVVFITGLSAGDQRQFLTNDCG